MSESKRSRASSLRWVPIAETRVSPRAQRDFSKAHAEEYAADFDLEALGYPVVSLRGDHYWIVDGQHRIAALKLIGWGDQSIECECYEGLTEEGEADLYLRRARRRGTKKFDEFRIAVAAQRGTQCQIERIVQREGLKISAGQDDGAISAVGALETIYGYGTETFTRALRILRDSFVGDSAAFRAHLIKGMGLVCQRYDGVLDDERAVQRLSALSGGTIALTRRADALKLKTGHRRPDCVAAAIVDTINSGKGGSKLESWWR